MSAWGRPQRRHLFRRCALAVHVFEQGDARGAGGVVLDVSDRGRRLSRRRKSDGGRRAATTRRVIRPEGYVHRLAQQAHQRLPGTCLRGMARRARRPGSWAQRVYVSILYLPWRTATSPDVDGPLAQGDDRQRVSWTCRSRCGCGASCPAVDGVHRETLTSKTASTACLISVLLDPGATERVLATVMQA